jgi:hypothetical protein
MSARTELQPPSPAEPFGVCGSGADGRSAGLSEMLPTEGSGENLWDAWERNSMSKRAERQRASRLARPSEANRPHRCVVSNARSAEGRGWDRRNCGKTFFGRDKNPSRLVYAAVSLEAGQMNSANLGFIVDRFLKIISNP